jgi:methylenetetrahydrofolate reductase (NADPH)
MQSTNKVSLFKSDFEQYVRETAAKIQDLESREKELLKESEKKTYLIDYLQKMQEFTPVRVAEKVRELEAKKERFIAFEYFPPKTQSGVENLRDRMVRMKRHRPLYVDVTWGAGGSTSDTTIEICADAQKRGLTACMHLTCTNMPREKIDQALKDAEKYKLVNILALRGDPPVGQVDFKPVESGFACALDLIKFLKKQTGDKFGISAAGYPEGHPERIRKASELGRGLTPSEEARCSVDYATKEKYVCSDEDYLAELAYLKEKVDAGAEFIVTQMFFDVQVYLDFVDACRTAGITVPIIPGLMCITSVPGFFRMVAFCRTRVPQNLYDAMKKLEANDNPDELKAFAIAYGIDMCQKLLEGGRSCGLHFYTLNLEHVVDGILKGIHWE